MRTGLAASLLLHAAAVAVAWTVAVPDRAWVEPPGVALRFALEPRAEPETLPPPPPLPRETAPPVLDPPREEPAPVDAADFVPQEVRAVPAEPRPSQARLARPLFRPAAPPPPEPAPPVAAPAPPPAPAAEPSRVVPPRLADGARATVDYPPAARRRGLEGRVVVRARLDARGRVEEATVSESSGHAVLDEAALAAVRTWRFAPATRDGVPVPHVLRVPVRFELG